MFGIMMFHPALMVLVQGITVLVIEDSPHTWSCNVLKNLDVPTTHDCLDGNPPTPLNNHDGRRDGPMEKVLVIGIGDSPHTKVGPKMFAQTFRFRPPMIVLTGFCPASAMVVLGDSMIRTPTRFRMPLMFLQHAMLTMVLGKFPGIAMLIHL